MSVARPIVLAGSIAIDRIMSFGGSYADYLHPDSLGSVSVSIFLDSLQDSYGGVAANIAYSLSLLGEEPYLLGSVGKDGLGYLEKLAHQGINIAHVHESAAMTASFNVITDADQNQIGGFYPGAMFDSASLSLSPWEKQNPLVVVSPHDPKAMLTQIQECQKMDLSLCYDVGQQVSNTPAQELQFGLEVAEVLLLNEYEMDVLCQRTNWSRKEIASKVPVVIVTSGPQGSRIEGSLVPEPIEIGVARATLVLDPTGAGDAYRAGFVYGYARDWPLQDAAQLGAVCASFAVETKGTQTHNPSRADIVERYEQAFGPAPFKDLIET
ncbi:MAG: carbohydrate kinase family protein [Candidatus Saccharimonadales bacterium]